MFLLAKVAAALRPVWGEHGGGAAWMAGAVGANAVLGVLLQLIALRALRPADYATFVLGLGVGNVASAISTAVQPVVAVRSARSQAEFLPAAPIPLLALTLAVLGIGALTLGRSLGFFLAAMILIQVPLHSVIGVGLGRLQAARRFAGIAASLSSWSAGRLLVAGIAVLAGHGTATTFVLALPAGLVLNMALMVALRAYRGVSWKEAPDRRQLLTHYSFWALVAWLLSADAVYARLALPPAGAGEYAIALTIGRQPVYAAAPAATVLLPEALAAGPEQQRARLRAIAGIAALLFVGAVTIAGVWPALILRLLTGGSDAMLVSLVRAYAVVGSLAAAATLLVTFVFALRPASSVWPVAGLAAAGLAATLFLVHDPWQLLAVQACAMLALVVIYGRAALAVTRVSTSPVEAKVA